LNEDIEAIYLDAVKIVRKHGRMTFEQAVRKVDTLAPFAADFAQQSQLIYYNSNYYAKLALSGTVEGFLCPSQSNPSPEAIYLFGQSKKQV
jgi:hypothetical protein